MDYLHLDKTKLVNLEISLYREVLLTNRVGSYCSSTIINCNTRKYHGMLVCPIDNFNGDSYILLSSLDVSLVQHDQAFNLGIRKYNGNHYDPKGHKYFTDFEMEQVPKSVYRVGGMVLSTETLLNQDEEQMLYKVTLEDAHSPTKIRFKPFLAFRNIHELTQQNMNANTRYEKIKQGIKIKMYEGFPYLHMQVSKKAEFIAVPDWYTGVEYFKEQSRGYDYKEDLFVPGYFEVDIKKGESIIFSASTSEIKPSGLKAVFTAEKKKCIPQDSMFNCLMNASEQFIQNRNGHIRLLAGYHWHSERLRDSFVSIPGLMTFRKDKEIFLKIFDEALEVTRFHFLSNCDENYKKSLKNVDVPLWAFYTMQEIESMLPEIDILDKYGKYMQDAFQYIFNLKRDFLNVDESGLIYAKIDGKPLTWMDSVINGEPATWRPGFTVEVNALWYNALCYYSELCKKKKKNKEAKKYSDFAQKVKESFEKVFWNEKGDYLYDYVDGDYKDDSIRPNQVIATALKYSPLDIDKRKMVIDIAKKWLLTPSGLRTLSPQSPKFEGVLEGNLSQRDLARHRGSVFPWITAFFAEAYLSIHKQGGAPFIKKLIEEFDDAIRHQCLGTMSECYNGSPPHTGKGAVSMAWNVAGVLKIIKLIEKYS